MSPYHRSREHPIAKSALPRPQRDGARLRAHGQQRRRGRPRRPGGRAVTTARAPGAAVPLGHEEEPGAGGGAVAGRFEDDVSLVARGLGPDLQAQLGGEVGEAVEMRRDGLVVLLSALLCDLLVLWRGFGGWVFLLGEPLAQAGFDPRTEGEGGLLGGFLGFHFWKRHGLFFLPWGATYVS